MDAERILVDGKYSVMRWLFKNEEGEREQGVGEFGCLI